MSAKKRSATEAAHKKRIDEILKASAAIEDDDEDEFLEDPVPKIPKKTRDTATSICISVIGILYFSVVLLNLFQKSRPTVSETENRNLTAFPDFSVSALKSGEYTDNLSLFFSDTFICREQLVGFSQKLERLHGISGSFSVLTGMPGRVDVGDKPYESTPEKPQFPVEAVSDGGANDTLHAIPEPLPETESAPDPVPELSQSTLSLPAGGTAELGYSVPGGGEITVSQSSDCISFSVGEDKITVTGKSAGEAVLTVSCGGFDSFCAITVTEVRVTEGDAEADFLADGLFIYRGAVYTISGYGETASGYLAKCADYYRSLFPGTRVSVLPAPVSSVTIDDPAITSKFTGQDYILGAMQSRMSAGVNFVNTYNTMFSHRSEYLYFKSDHHWTGLGAYYAYTDFASSVGLVPVPKEELDHRVLNDSYNGSMYGFTGDERVKGFIDTVEAFIPRRAVQMTVTTRTGATVTYDRTVVEENGSYLSFIGGDNPYTVINVPDNPQSLSILVLKDSYGNAFVPYLTEHYGNIIVVDPRYCDINVYEHFRDYGLTDILFVTNIQSMNSMKWPALFLQSVGAGLDSVG